MASNSSAAAVAALFGIRDGDHQEQIKPLLAQPHQQLPPAPLLSAAASSSAPGSAQAAAASPPVKKKRTLPGNNILYIASKSSSIPAMHIFFLLRILVIG